MLIFRPNFLEASEKASTIFCISSAVTGGDIPCTVVGPAQRTFLVAVRRRQNITSTVLRLPLKPYCVSGTNSGVMWLDSLLRRILAKILLAMERREIPL